MKLGRSFCQDWAGLHVRSCEALFFKMAHKEERHGLSCEIRGSGPMIPSVAKAS